MPKRAGASLPVAPPSVVGVKARGLGTLTAQEERKITSLISTLDSHTADLDLLLRRKRNSQCHVFAVREEGHRER